MAEVPVSLSQLEDIVVKCVQDLMEKWAIAGLIDNDNIEFFSELSVDTVSFVIEKFMGYMNEVLGGGE